MNLLYEFITFRKVAKRDCGYMLFLFYFCIKNHHVYTTKFNLYVVDLTQTKQAGEQK